MQWRAFEGVERYIIHVDRRGHRTPYLELESDMGLSDAILSTRLIIWMKMKWALAQPLGQPKLKFIIHNILGFRAPKKNGQNYRRGFLESYNEPMHVKRCNGVQLMVSKGI